MACESDQKSVARVKLKVNGKETELNNFVESFISQSIIGMVKSLRGVDNIETIDLKISTKSEKPQGVNGGAKVSHLAGG